jgi:uncharacterized protein (DUF305 family)
MFLQMMIPHHQQAVDISELTSAMGKEFDLLWLAGMTNHHEGAIHMTTMIEDANKQEVKNFGEAIVATQSAQIEQMSEMVKRLNN